LTSYVNIARNSLAESAGSSLLFLLLLRSHRKGVTGKGASLPLAFLIQNKANKSQKQTPLFVSHHSAPNISQYQYIKDKDLTGAVAARKSATWQVK